ncbi:MAG: ATP-binding protein [Planctomycetota bacterium]
MSVPLEGITDVVAPVGQSVAVSLVLAVSLALGGVFVGVLSGYVAALLRIRGRTEKRLGDLRDAERRAASAERMAEVGAMTAGLAHEIKNPLSTIGLNAQLVQEGIADLDDIDEQNRGRLLRRVDALRREAERLGSVLGDFLEYAGELRIEPAPSDLNILAEDLADIFGPKAVASRVTLRFEPHPTPATARLDAPHVKQSVLNLLLNATQAMSRNAAAAEPTGSIGELIMRVTADEALAGSDAVALRITDTGPGIDPDTLERVFAPYFTTRAGGSGLGLPIARRIVEAHGGRIDVRTEVGKGTEFALVFPALPTRDDSRSP